MKQRSDRHKAAPNRDGNDRMTALSARSVAATPAIRTSVPTAPPQLGRLDGFIGYQLRLANDASFHAFARRVGNNDLKPGRFTLLALIGQNDGLTPTALSRISGRDKSSITPALHDLERRGLIRRKPVPGDRRSCTLALTAPGRAALCQLMGCAEEHDRHLDEIIGPRSRARFVAQLRRIVAALTTGGDMS
jgi:DNA-binding MarR family transcriptional regulator